MPTTPAPAVNAEAEIERLRRQLAERDATLAAVLAAQAESDDDIPAIVAPSTAPPARRSSALPSSTMIANQQTSEAPQGMSDEEFARYLQAQENAAARPATVTQGPSRQVPDHTIVHSDEILSHSPQSAPAFFIRSTTPPQLPNAVLRDAPRDSLALPSTATLSRQPQRNGQATLQSTAAVRSAGARAQRPTTYNSQPSGDEAYAATLQQMEIIMAQRGW
jgi:hypothetical protein